MSDIGAGTLGGALQTGAVGSREFNSAALQNLDKDTFLQLLVAQMRYQNPMSPVDSNQFLAQAAQYASVEQLENMAQRQAELRSMQMITVATGLVGRQVTAVSDLTGETVRGVVETVRFGEEPILVVDGADIPLSRVVQVDAAGPDAPTPPTPTEPTTTAPAVAADTSTTNTSAATTATPADPTPDPAPSAVPAPPAAATDEPDPAASAYASSTPGSDPAVAVAAAADAGPNPVVDALPDTPLVAPPTDMPATTTTTDEPPDAPAAAGATDPETSLRPRQLDAYAWSAGLR